MINKLKNLSFQIIESCIRNISGRIGFGVRQYYYSRRFAKCGNNLVISEGVIIEGPENMYLEDSVWIDKYCILMAGKVDDTGLQIKHKNNKNYKNLRGELRIGSCVHIAPQCILQAHGGISIGNNCGFSSGVKIYSFTNLPNKPNGEIVHFTPLGNAYYLDSPIFIAENVGIALNGIVLPGVSIYKNSFIAPNSVVVSSIRENSFAKGNPAKKVKARFENYE